MSSSSVEKRSSRTSASTVPDTSAKDSHKMNSFERLKIEGPAAPLKDRHNMYFTIAKQIEYYFSPVSLWKNIFLRQHMNEQGWVPVSVIAGFFQVQRLMKRIRIPDEFILNAVKTSTIVETEGDKIRKRSDWIRWILPRSVGVSKDGNSTNPEMNNHLRSSNREGTVEGKEIEDYLRELCLWDTIEDLKMTFSNFTCELMKKMKVHDQQIVVDYMKGLLEDLLSKYDFIKVQFDDAAKSSSEGLFDLIIKHPCVVDMPVFQELFSDEDTTIPENKGKMLIAMNKGKMPNEEPDEQRVKVLQQGLFKELLDFEDMIGSVESFIISVEKKALGI